MKRFQCERRPFGKKPTNLLIGNHFPHRKLETITKELNREEFLKDELRIYAVDYLIRNINEAVHVLAKHK